MNRELSKNNINRRLLPSLPIIHNSLFFILPPWPLAFYRVYGESMLPTYHSGDLLLGWRWIKPRVDQIVVLQTPKRHIIKRIKQVNAKGVWLEGDNASASADSRTQGWYPIDDIKATIIAKLG